LPNKETKHSYSIQSVDNALDVLEALCTEGEEVRVSHLSKRLGMNKMSLFRYLATFENRGYVEKTKGSGRYRLGQAAYETGQKLLFRNSLLRKAKPAIEKLARDCNEAIYLAVPRGNDFLLLDMVDTAQQIKIIPLLGNRYPMQAASAGRVMLAHDNRHREACDSDAMENIRADLAAILTRGCDYDNGGFGEGIASLAVPLHNGDGDVPGSLCMIAPEFRLTREEAVHKMLPQLLAAGDVISSKLGYIEHLINTTSLEKEIAFEA